MDLLLVVIGAFSLFFIQTGDAVDQCDTLFLVEAVRQRNLDIVRWLTTQRANINVQDDEGTTPLMHASLITDNTDMILELLGGGAEPDMKENDGKTALHLAAEIGAIDTVQILFGRMKNSNITDNQGRSALHSSLKADDTRVLSYFIEQGMDCYIKDANGLSPIHEAALLGMIPALKIFTSKEDIDINSVTDDGSTALILSSLYGQNEAAKFLINAGANINIKDNNGWTALHAAAYSGELELLKLLVEENATLNDTNLDGQTSLYLAVTQGHLAVSEYLVGKGSTTAFSDKYGNTLLHAAAKSGNVKLLEFFVGKNIKLDEMNHNGSTPLVVAAVEGYEDATEFLVKAGADKSVIKKLGLPFLQLLVSTNNTNTLKCIKNVNKHFVHNTNDSRGVTLLHHASKNSNNEMVKYLLQLMVEDYIQNKYSNLLDKKREINGLCLQCYVSVTNIKDVDGKTPLHYAVRWDNTDNVDVLLNKGAIQSITDNKGINPFHVAASQGLTDILIKLTPHNHNINAVDDDGKTALYHSVEAGQLDSMKYLINIGAATTIKDSHGRSLIHAASATGDKSVLQELIKLVQLNSSDINVRDNEGKTPAWYAINNKHFDILPELEQSGAQIEQNELCDIVSNGNLEYVRYFISRNKLIDNKCFGSKTILHIAASKGFVDIIRELKNLCQYSSMINKLDNENKTPLWYAINGGKWDCATELEKIGGEIKPAVTLKTATYENKINFVKYFVNNGADIGPESPTGWPIISDAAFYGNNDIIIFLLESGADIEALIPPTKRSAIHIAAMNGRCSTIELLQSKGASINRLDKDGMTALDFAMKRKEHDCKDVLLKHGAISGKVELTDENDYTSSSEIE